MFPYNTYKRSNYEIRGKAKTIIPTLVVFEKYAVALGKRIELRLSDEE